MERTPKETIIACLLGGALGDALGYPIEFVESGAAIVDTYGQSAPARILRCSDGRVHVSDDTQMTLFTVEGLLRARAAGRSVAAATADVHAAYQRWLYTQWPERFERPARVEEAGEGAAAPDVRELLDVGELFARRAPGNTCLSALFDNVQNARIPSVAAPPNESKGCGVIMRSAPFGLAATTREEAFTAARDCGVLTHGHPSGYLSGAYFASLVFDLARGSNFAAACAAADVILARESGHEEVAAALAAVASLSRPPSHDVIEALPNGGWVGEWALAIGVACIRGVDPSSEADVAHAIWRAAAHGGDSDSTASVAGNLLGAMGAKLPAAWLEELELRDVIERLAAELALASA